MVDPARLEGEELERWYRRSPHEIEAEREVARQLEYDDYVARTRRVERADEDATYERWRADRDPSNGQLTGWQLISTAGPKKDNPFDPTTGRLSWSEIERIYDEQKRRVRGEGEPEPSEITLGSLDRLPDGQIPEASQLTKGHPERDPTCHPNGGWELDPGYNSYPDWTKQYENQVTRAPGVDYVIRNLDQKPVKLDGCAVWDPRHPLLEAKGPGYAGLLTRAARSTFGDLVLRSLRAQVGRQVTAAGGRPIDWHVAEPLAAAVFDGPEVRNERPISVMIDWAR